MIDEILEWFDNFDGQILGYAFLIWAVCMIVLWKLTYTKIMDTWAQILVSIIMLPICYVIVYFMANR